MFTKSIGRLAASANRRRTEQDVRVDRAVQELAQPPRHRTPARGARAALPQIQHQTPAAAPEGSWHVATDHGHLQGKPDLYTVHHTGTRQRIPFGTDREGAYAKMRELNRAAEPHTFAAPTVARLTREREAFLSQADELAAYRAELEQKRAALFDQCQGLWNEEQEQRRLAEDWRHLLGVARYGAPQPAAEVPRAPVDDSDADGAEPEPVDDEDDDTEAEQALDAYIAAEAPHDEELPEALTSGPAAVPQLVLEQGRGAYSRYVIGDGDPDTVRLSPVRDGDTETMVLDGVER